MSEDTAELAGPSDEVLVLQGRLRRAQYLVFAALAVAIIALVLAVFLLIRQGSLLAGNERAGAQLVEQQQQLSGLQSIMDSRFADRDEQRTALGNRVNALARQLTNLDVNDPDNAIIGLQRILIRQERDYRDFLRDLEQGMQALHMMTPQSRGWWDGMQSDIRDSAARSEARENYIFNLRE